MRLGEGSKPASRRRKSTSSLVCNTKISSNNAVVLQQLRVALKKLPDAKLTSVLASAASEAAAAKRRHSDSGLNNVSSSKKAKMSEKRPLLASGLKGQGKITEYLPEMKHFIAMRKEKLDRVLNLHPLDLASTASTEPTKADNIVDISSSCSSTPKKSSMCSNSESGIDTGSVVDTASVASSGSRSSSGIGSNNDQEIFEVPRTIRFPPAAPTKIYSEVVICKWELCGTEFDSTGKLLDHLKVRLRDCL